MGDYDITLEPLYAGLQKVDIAEAKRLSDHPWFNRTLCAVNESLARRAATLLGLPSDDGAVIRHATRALYRAEWVADYLDRSGSARARMRRDDPEMDRWVSDGLAISGEDDPPDRPINVMASSMSFSRAASSATCDGRINGQPGLTLSRSNTGTPFATNAFASETSASSASTTPLPIRQLTPSRRIPDGIRCRTVFLPSMTSVCPAL